MCQLNCRGIVMASPDRIQRPLDLLEIYVVSVRHSPHLWLLLLNRKRGGGLRCRCSTVIKLIAYLSSLGLRLERRRWTKSFSSFTLTGVVFTSLGPLGGGWRETQTCTGNPALFTLQQSHRRHGRGPLFMAGATNYTAGAAEQLVDDVLRSRKAELGLSLYTYPELRWMIRNHLIGLVSEFPGFLPSAEGYRYENGKVNVLVNAAGRLSLSSPIHIPLLYLKLWLPRQYPHLPPMAVVSSPGPDATLAHPYLDPTTGEAIAAPYLTSWEFPYSNLAELVYSLVSAFETNPPFPALCSPRGRIVYQPEECEPEQLALEFGNMALAIVPGDQQVTSWEDTLDELTSRIHQDILQVAADGLEAEEVAARMRKRWCRVSRALSDLGREVKELKVVGQGLSEHADVLSNWVRANDTGMFPADSPEEVFEPAEAEASAESWSAWNALELDVSCRAIDDLLLALEEALKERVISVQEYLKQVKTHAREQLLLRAEAMKAARRARKAENRGNTVESFSGLQQTKPNLGT